MHDDREPRRRRAAVDWASAPLRCLLFAPGSDRRKLEKVESFGADAIVLDLEDAVAEDQKDAARALVREALAAYTRVPIVFARVNGWQTGRTEQDLAAVVCADLDGVMLPKLEEAEALRGVDRLLGELERRHGLPSGRIRLLPIVETALGLSRCEALLAEAPARTLTVAFGAVDFSLDVGVDLRERPAVVEYASARVIVAARAARLAAPIDAPHLDIPDLEGLAADTRRARSQGFQGRVAIHPRQVAVVQRVFSDLSPEEERRARVVVAAFEEAQARGVASLQVEGMFVDYPVYYREQRRLALLARLTAAGATE